jgi:apolipoprotein N-acyltransferase
VQARSPEFERDALVETVTLPRGHTLATQWGMLPEIVLSLIGVLAVACAVLVGRRRGRMDS